MGVINPVGKRVVGLINPIVKKVLGLSPGGSGFIPDPNKSILKSAFFDVLCALKINPKRYSRVLATFLQKSTYCLLKNALWGLGLRKNTVFFACSQKPKNIKKLRVFFKPQRPRGKPSRQISVFCEKACKNAWRELKTA